MGFVVVRQRGAGGLGIGAALGALGSTSAHAPPTPAYYARASSLRWTDNNARALHDMLVKADAFWMAFLRIWESIPGIDLALDAAGIDRKDVEKLAGLPLPGASQLALVLEGTFGQRPLDDTFVGILNDVGATMAALAGYFGVCAALATVAAGFAAVGGFASLGITIVADVPLLPIAGINALLAAIATLLASLCFGLAGKSVDCEDFAHAVHTVGGALNHDPSDSATSAACNFVRTKYLQQRADAVAAAKQQSRAKTAVAKRLAAMLGVSYATLFKASTKDSRVANWISACVNAAKAGRRLPTAPSAVVAAVPGASGDDVKFGGASVAPTPGGDAPLERPGPPWWGIALAGLVLGGSVGWVWRKSKRRKT